MSINIKKFATDFNNEFVDVYFYEKILKSCRIIGYRTDVDAVIALHRDGPNFYPQYGVADVILKTDLKQFRFIYFRPDKEFQSAFLVNTSDKMLAYINLPAATSEIIKIIRKKRDDILNKIKENI